MEYIKLSLGYIRRRFLYLALYAIVPAVLFMLTTEPASVFDFIVEKSGNGAISFKDVLFGVTELNWRSLIFLMVTGLVCIVALSGMFGLIEKDMRLGLLTNSKFLRRVNDNFLSVLKVFVVFILFMELYGLITASFFYLWIKVLGGTLAVVFCSITFIVLSTLFLYVCSSLLIWCPSMIITGLNSRKSLLFALRAVKGHGVSLFLALCLPLIPMYTVIFVQNYFGVQVFTKYILNTVAYLLLFIYIGALMFSAYFSLTGTDREDLKKRSIWDIKE